MLISFRIKNFMSFRDDTLFTMEPDVVIEQSGYDIINGKNILKISALFGANASGKSTLLRALQALCTIVRMNYDRGSLRSFIVPFSLTEDDAPIEFEILFSRCNHVYHYGISFLKDVVIEEFLYIDDIEFLIM